MIYFNLDSDEDIFTTYKLYHLKLIRLTHTTEVIPNIMNSDVCLWSSNHNVAKEKYKESLDYYSKEPKDGSIVFFNSLYNFYADSVFTALRFLLIHKWHRTSSTLIPDAKIHEESFKRTVKSDKELISYWLFYHNIKFAFIE